MSASHANGAKRSYWGSWNLLVFAYSDKLKYVCSLLIYRPNARSMCYIMYVLSTISGLDSNRSRQCSRLKVGHSEKGLRRRQRVRKADEIAKGG
jgi:hypothetical protein